MSLKSLIATGTKLWLDSIEPQLVNKNRRHGGHGATSNPIIISDIIKSGGQDDKMMSLIEQGHDDTTIAWEMTDKLVKAGAGGFSAGVGADQGEQRICELRARSAAGRCGSRCRSDRGGDAAKYVELGKKWAAGHKNRMIKVPATAAGLAALEELAAAGVTLNVTLIFSERQYKIARDAVWRGAQRRKDGAGRIQERVQHFRLPG